MTLKLRPKGNGGPRGVSEAQLVEALKKNVGNVMAAAQSLGISDAAIYQRLRNHPELAQIRKDAEERLTDIAESHLYKAVNRGEWDKVRWWLDRKGKDRGYVTRSELANPDGSALLPPVVNIAVTYVGPEEDVV